MSIIEILFVFLVIGLICMVAGEIGMRVAMRVFYRLTRED